MIKTILQKYNSISQSDFFIVPRFFLFFLFAIITIRIKNDLLVLLLSTLLFSDSLLIIIFKIKSINHTLKNINNGTTFRFYSKNIKITIKDRLNILELAFFQLSYLLMCALLLFDSFFNLPSTSSNNFFFLCDILFILVITLAFYIFLPSITIILLPLYGYLIFDMSKEYISLNNMNYLLYQIICMLVFSIFASLILGFLFPLESIRQVNSWIYIVIALFLTIILLIMKNGVQSDFSSAINSLTIYITIIGVDSSLFLKIDSQKKKAVDKLILEKPISKMNYSELQHIAYIGGQNYVNIILSNDIARSTIDKVEK